MKRISILSFILSALFIGQVGFSQAILHESFKQYYAGGLYSGTIKDYDQVEHIFSARFGGIFELPLPGKVVLHSKLIWDDGFKTDTRLVKKYLSLTLSAGYMPTITRQFNTPNPVSAEGHFIPPSQAIISPGFHPGIMLDNNLLFLGAYSVLGDSLQFHLGLKPTFRKGAFVQSLKVGAYTANRKSSDDRLLLGGGATIQTKRFSLTLFSEHNAVWTYSGFLSCNLPADWSTYVSLTQRDDAWRHAEIGVLKSAYQDFGNTRINYCYGYGYQKYPQEMSFLYLQVYLFRVIK